MDSRLLPLMFAAAMAGCGSGSIDVSTTFKSLPGDITYNHAEHDSGVEYEWAVGFDTNNDGAINAGDHVLRIFHEKTSGATEQAGRIADFGGELLVYESDSAMKQVMRIAPTVDTANRTIRFAIERNAADDLDEITSDTKVNFRGVFFDPDTNSTSNDYWPANSKTYGSVPESGVITDDAETNSNFPALIDLQTMTVTVEFTRIFGSP